MFASTLACGFCCAVLHSMIGMSWYSYFSKQWMAWSRVTQEQVAAGSKNPPYGKSFLTAWFQAIVLMQLIDRTNFVLSLCSTFVLWAGFVGPTQVYDVLFSPKDRRVWLIDAGFQLAVLSTFAIVCCLWPLKV